MTSTDSVQALGKTSKSIKYYTGLLNDSLEECAPADFEARALAKELYELILDDVPVKVYFDADHKFREIDDYSTDAAANVLRIHELCVAAYLREKTGIEPRFAAAEAHCARKTIKGVEYSKYSFHLVVVNILMYKMGIKQMVPELNDFIAKDQAGGFSAITSADKYADYMDSPGPAFDTAPYHATCQKMRCVHANKPGENRPFKLIEGHGTFEDIVITGFFAPDAIVYVPPKPVFVPRELAAAPASDMEREINQEIMQTCFDRGMFIEAARNYGDWLKMGLFIKGYIGDNTAAYTLFDEFSKLGGVGSVARTPVHTLDYVRTVPRILDLVPHSQIFCGVA